MQFHRKYYFFVSRCQISRTQSTNEEPMMIITQSINLSYNFATLRTARAISTWFYKNKFFLLRYNISPPTNVHAFRKTTKQVTKNLY